MPIPSLSLRTGAYGREKHDHVIVLLCMSPDAELPLPVLLLPDVPRESLSLCGFILSLLFNIYSEAGKQFATHVTPGCFRWWRFCSSELGPEGPYGTLASSLEKEWTRAGTLPR